MAEPKRPRNRKATPAEAAAARAELSGKALGLAMKLIPGEAVRALAQATAPLSRYSGLTKTGTATLGAALALLAKPPMRLGDGKPMTVEQLAEVAEVGVSTVEDWLQAGLLGAPVEAEGSPHFGRDSVERVRLLAYLERHGTPASEVLKAAAEDRLPLLVLDRSLVGDGIYDSDEAARRAGVEPELAIAMWRALGFATGGPGDRIYTHREVEALRLMSALRTVFTDEDLLESATVIGRSMAATANAAVEVFTRRITGPFAAAGASEMDIAFRLAAIAELMVAPSLPLLELAYRRHLELAGRAETVLRVEAASGGLGGHDVVSIGFADIVGFTSRSEELSALELSAMARRLAEIADDILPRSGGRVVKNIGDAVMFTCKNPIAAADAATQLVEAAAADAALPPLRVGIAHGPVVRSYADFFGLTVNVASRLCDAAESGEVLLLVPEEEISGSAWSKAGLRVASTSRLRLKGLEQRVEAITIERAKPTRKRS